MLSRLSVFFFVLLASIGWISCGHSTHATHPAYVTVPASNHVVGFNIDNKSGSLKAMSKSPFVTGNGPASITVHPSKKFAYVANAGDATIALYTIGTSSELTEVPPRVATGANPIALTIDPSGSFLYAASAGSNSISVYSINSSSGTLSEITGSPFAAGTAPLFLAVDPAGTFLFVGNQSSNNISGFTINSSTGALAATSPATAGTGSAPTSMFIPK